MTNTTTVNRTVLLRVALPAMVSIDTLRMLGAEAVRVLDEHAIVRGWDYSPTYGRIDIRVTFANEAEIAGLVKVAHNAALHIASCDVEVGR